MKWISRFARFWYDFIVGDDWRMAVVVAVGLGVTALLAHHGYTAWPVLPIAVVVALVGTARRALRDR
ncbi:MAG: hypothetical protein WCI22_11975 [Actinomycetota bacterium]